MNDLIEVYNPITGEKTYVSEEKMAELAMHFNSMIHDESIPLRKEKENAR